MLSKSIADLAVPLRTLDPATNDDSDLGVLRDVIGNARVVCVGESAHFVSEFIRLRDDPDRRYFAPAGQPTPPPES